MLRVAAALWWLMVRVDDVIVLPLLLLALCVCVRAVFVIVILFLYLFMPCAVVVVVSSLLSRAVEFIFRAVDAG